VVATGEPSTTCGVGENEGNVEKIAMGKVSRCFKVKLMEIR
jgi:hypothetical protein